MLLCDIDIDSRGLFRCLLRLSFVSKNKHTVFGVHHFPRINSTTRDRESVRNVFGIFEVKVNNVCPRAICLYLIRIIMSVLNLMSYFCLIYVTVSSACIKHSSQYSHVASSAFPNFPKITGFLFFFFWTIKNCLNIQTLYPETKDAAGIVYRKTFLASELCGTAGFCGFTLIHTLQHCQWVFIDFINEKWPSFFPSNFTYGGDSAQCDVIIIICDEFYAEHQTSYY